MAPITTSVIRIPLAIIKTSFELFTFHHVLFAVIVFNYEFVELHSKIVHLYPMTFGVNISVTQGLWQCLIVVEKISRVFRFDLITFGVSILVIQGIW